MPFPALHVDPAWKYRKMFSFRNDLVDQRKLNLLVHTYEVRLRRGIGPVIHQSILYTTVMKTGAFKRAVEKINFDAARDGCVMAGTGPMLKSGFFHQGLQKITDIPSIKDLTHGRYKT